MPKAIKQLSIAATLISAAALAVLAAIWFTSPTRLGEAAFHATGLPNRTLAEARVLATQENKPLLMDFSAYWCSWCRKFDREVFSHPDVRARIEQDYVFVRMDSEDPQTRPLMRKYDIHGFPTMLVTKADGTPLYRLPVVFEPDSFLNALIVAREKF